MDALELQLPWPPTQLSPNSRLHWAMVYRAKAKYRDACWATVRAQTSEPLREKAEYALELRFVPPDRRSYDRDNLIARMKAGLDGLADALMIDDKQFTRLTASVSADSVGGFVEVRITPISQGDSDGNEVV
jgi:crossover junction endodeoxyribonuclease RusA